MNKVLFSSNYDSWRTPSDLFNSLNDEFHFTIDLCADDQNHLCNKYFTINDSCLNHFPVNEVIFCNPPYSKHMILFIKHCFDLRRFNNTIVLLLPVRSDTKWFHNYIYNKEGVTIRFIKGRVHFSGARLGAPFPCMIVIMLPSTEGFLNYE